MNILFSETQDGSGFADINFATVTKSFDEYIVAEALDVVMLADLVHIHNCGRSLSKSLCFYLFEVSEEHIFTVCAKKR